MWQESRQRPSRAAGQVDQLGGLVEVTADQAFVACGLLEQQVAVVGVLERRLDHFRRPFQRRPEGFAFGRAGVEDNTGGADPVTDPQRVGQRRE
jgi:hypothetical protein